MDRSCVIDEQYYNVKPYFRRMFYQIVVDVVIWFTAAFPVLFLYFWGQPFDRGFFCHDPNLSYPYKPDTITTTVLVVSGFGVSGIVILLVEILNLLSSSCRQRWVFSDEALYCVKGYAVFLVGFVIQQLVVEVVKTELGVLRPNFFDVCKPHFNTTLCPGYITQYTCNGTDLEQIRDSRQSFPSGHSAFSMYVAAFFCIYIQLRLEITFSHTLKFFLQFGLIMLALLCGISRIKDNKHHAADVIAGFILGVVVAFFVYKMIGTKFMHAYSAADQDESRNIKSRPNHLGYTVSRGPGTESQSPLPLLSNDFLNYDQGHTGQRSMDVAQIQNQHQTSTTANNLNAQPV